MIDLEFILADGSSRMVYNVQLADRGIHIPPGAYRVRVWLGTAAARHTASLGQRSTAEIIVDGIMPTSGGGAV